MKHTKRMMLVEAPDETETNKPTSAIVSQNNDPQSYLRSNTIPNLDNELKQILDRRDIPDRQKWLLYNQILQRYLFFLKQEKSKNSFSSMLSRYSPFDRAPVLDSKPQFKNIYEPSIPKRSHQNVQPFNFDIEYSSPSANIPNIPDDIELEHMVNNEDLQHQIDSNDTPSLPFHDFDLNDDPIYDVNDITETPKVRRKRNSSDSIFLRKKIGRKDKKPIYNWMPRPALNRWEIEQNNKAKIAKQNRLIHSYSERKPERMVVETRSNKRTHADTFHDFDHSLTENTIVRKRPKIVLNRKEFERLLKEYSEAGSELIRSQNDKQSGGSVNSIECILKWDKP